MSTTQKLFLAAYHGDCEQVCSLLAADPSLLNVRYDKTTHGKIAGQLWNNGKTCLTFAVSKGHTGLIKMLLREFSASLEVTQQDDDGWSALHLAAYLGYFDVVRLLCEDAACSSLDVNLRRSINGKTALMEAAGRGRYEITEYLITKHHADINARETCDNKNENNNNKIGRTALGFVVDRDAEMERLLRANGATL